MDRPPDRLAECVCDDEAAHVMGLCPVHPPERATDTPAADHTALLKAVYGLTDGLYLEALNGVLCTPPDTVDPFSDTPSGNLVDVDAPLGRRWCSSCQRLWREVMALRRECGRELGYKEFRDD